MHWQLVENEMYRESLGPSLSTSPARVLPCRPLRLPLLSASCRMRRFLTAREKASSLAPEQQPKAQGTGVEEAARKRRQLRLAGRTGPRAAEAGERRHETDLTLLLGRRGRGGRGDIVQRRGGKVLEQVAKVLVELHKPLLDDGNLLRRALRIALLEAGGVLQLRQVVDDAAGALVGGELGLVVEDGRDHVEVVAQLGEVELLPDDGDQVHVAVLCKLVLQRDGGLAVLLKRGDAVPDRLGGEQLVVQLRIRRLGLLNPLLGRKQSGERRRRRSGESRRARAQRAGLAQERTTRGERLRR